MPTAERAARISPERGYLCCVFHAAGSKALRANSQSTLRPNASAKFPRRTGIQLGTFESRRRARSPTRSRNRRPPESRWRWYATPRRWPRPTTPTTERQPQTAFDRFRLQARYRSRSWSRALATYDGSRSGSKVNVWKESNRTGFAKDHKTVCDGWDCKKHSRCTLGIFYNSRRGRSNIEIRFQKVHCTGKQNPYGNCR